MADDAETPVVAIDPGRVVVERFMGLGVQWDPYDKYQPSPEDWKTIADRMTFCRPGYLRVMGMAPAYCLGYDPYGRPRYVWEEGNAAQKEQFERLCAILDFARAHGVDVILGEWGPPRGLVRGETDPRWPVIIADLLAYLRKDRGYKIIRYYNLVNEPNISGSRNYETWLAGIRALRAEFDRRGLSKDVRIIGPDTTGNTSWREPFDWLDRAAKDAPDLFGAWDLHWYAHDPEVLGGEIERVLREKRDVVRRLDPHATGKPLFLGESGLLTGKVNGDQQPRVRGFEYGVMMADYVAQTARAGWEGALAWDLDDAMHVVRGDHAPDPPDDLTLKVWGFWNSQGSRMGRPEEMRLRPWFYTWSLMSRLYPKGSRIVQAVVENQPRRHGGTEGTPSAPSDRASSAPANDPAATVSAAASDSTAVVSGAANDPTAAISGAANDPTATVSAAARDPTAAISGAANDPNATVSAAARDSTAAISGAANDPTAAVSDPAGGSSAAISAPAGRSSAAVSDPDLPRFRVVAGTRRIRGTERLTVMLVNNDAESRSVTVRVPSARAKTSLTVYRYFDEDRPADDRGYPKPKLALRNVDLKEGVNVSLPSRGVVFLTTVPPDAG